ncbi:MAG: PLDc N-terminal domain-containing protein [Cyclobacteriaceae bacterium]
MSALLLVMGDLSGWGLPLLLLVVYIGTSIWLFALFDVMKSSFPNNEKIAWEQLVKHLPLLGALIYLAVGRNRKIT